MATFQKGRYARKESHSSDAMTFYGRNRLGDEAFRELEAYFDLCDSVNNMQVEAAFQHGFRLGANLLTVLYADGTTIIDYQVRSL
ncbi:DUF6809 family protein [Paenibacillus enshidis]|uniref:DUF6809 family protein n=1 Tax=Paenibacillus enshidis TaxID=1458439 RepID=A0ABV5B0F7_9BACL